VSRYPGIITDSCCDSGLPVRPSRCTKNLQADARYLQETAQSVGGWHVSWCRVDFLGQEKYHIVLESVTRAEGQKGFAVLPHRWVVERTLAWLNQCRRLSKDYEELPSTSETFVYVAMTRLMLKRLAA